MEVRRGRSTAVVYGPPQLTVEHVVRVCGTRWSVDKPNALRVPLEFADDLEAALGLNQHDEEQDVDDQLGLWSS